MKSFKQILKEYKKVIITESSKDDAFFHRYSKLHSDLPLVSENPEEAKARILYTKPHAQNHDEASYLTRAALHGHYRVGEDDLAISNTLKRFRKAKKEGKISENMSDFTHDQLNTRLNEVDPPNYNVSDSAPEQIGGSVQELSKFHIGDIPHPTLGRLSVYHLHNNGLQPDNRRDLIKFRNGLKSNSVDNCNWCVLHGQHGIGHLGSYSSGHGFLAYANNTGKFVLAHGHRDRGLVDPFNQVQKGKNFAHVADQTISLLEKKYGTNNGMVTTYDHVTGNYVKKLPPEETLKLIDRHKDHIENDIDDDDDDSPYSSKATIDSLSTFQSDPKNNSDPRVLFQLYNVHMKHYPVYDDNKEENEKSIHRLLNHPNMPQEVVHHYLGIAPRKSGGDKTNIPSLLDRDHHEIHWGSFDKFIRTSPKITKNLVNQLLHSFSTKFSNQPNDDNDSEDKKIGMASWLGPSIIKHPTIREPQITKIVSDSISKDKLNLSDSDHMKSRSMDNHSIADLIHIAHESPHYKPHHSEQLIKAFLDDKVPYGHVELSLHTHDDNDLLHKVYDKFEDVPPLDNDDPDRSQYVSHVRLTILHNKSFIPTEKQKENIFLHDNDFLKRHALRQPWITSDQLDLALMDNDSSIRTAAYEHPKATREHMELLKTETPQSMNLSPSEFGAWKTGVLAKANTRYSSQGLPIAQEIVRRRKAIQRLAEP